MNIENQDQFEITSDEYVDDLINNTLEINDLDNDINDDIIEEHAGYEVNENTVEYKVINRYARNNNILNKIYYESNPEYVTLMEFMKPFILDKHSTIKSNITCPGYRFYIPEDATASRFFELLKRCVDSKLVLHFRELQKNDYENKKGAGIMFDFDLLQENSENKLPTINFGKIISRMAFLMRKLLIFDDDESFHVAVIMKKTLVYKEDLKLYKNGFHFVIPEIMLARPAKKLLFNEMLHDKRFQELFRETFQNELVDAFDAGSYSVPVYFMYNCKESSTEPYELQKIVQVIFTEEGINVNQNDIMNTIKTYNMITELSLNFHSSLMKKKYYELKPEYHTKVMEMLNRVNVFEEEKEETLSTFNTYNSYVDDNLEYYKKIVLEILNIKRAEDRNMWRDVLFSLANIDVGLRPAFKPIGKLFSMRSESKYDSEGFEKMWAEACSNTSESRLTIKSLIYWAIEDNDTKFKKILNKNIHSTIEYDVYCRDNRILNGTLHQYQYAYYLKHLFHQKFAYDVDASGKNGQWFEFVLDNDDCDKGQIFKWRAEFEPVNLILYLSNKLPYIISNVIKKAEDRIANNPNDEEINNYILSRTKNLKKASQGLYKTGFKNDIIKEGKSLLLSRGFIKKLDTDQNIMGVGNGVLELSEKPRLIRHYHNYAISLYTETDYIPYNKHNPHVQKLLSVLLDLFPKHEMDAFHYIMYYIATCLDGKPKDSIILILTGSGSNGKSFLAELIKSVMGLYGAKMNMSFLTESRARSSNADEELMKLKTARLAYYSETEKNEALNTAKLKELTSQESMTGRGIYEKAKNFRPTCSHMVTTNYQFSIKTTDHGIWRRIVTYEFKMKFVDDPDPQEKYEKRGDPDVAKKFSFDPEIKKAFLSIIVEYYKDLHINHKGELKNIAKPTIDKEVAEYRNKEDVLNRFLDEHCILSKDAKTCISEFTERYAAWYELNFGKISKPEPNEINNQMNNSKLAKYIKKGSSRVVVHGIRIINFMLPEDEVLAGDECFLREKHNTRYTSNNNTYNESRFNPLNL